MLSEEEIREAVRRGNDQYWADSKAQSEAHRRWMEDGRINGPPCEQHTKGSIIDYIVREVVACQSR